MISQWIKRLKWCTKAKEKSNTRKKDKDLLEKIPKLKNYFPSSRKENSVQENQNEQVSESSSDTNKETTVETMECEPIGSENAFDVFEQVSSNLSFSNVSTSTNIITQFSNDPGLWDIKNHQSRWIKQGIVLRLFYCDLNSKFNISPNFRNIQFSGSDKCQNFDTVFHIDSKGRHFLKFHLERTLANGSQVNREWIVYSPSTKSIFCFACRLFNPHNEKDTFSSKGFNDWKNATRAIGRHERSETHRSNDCTYNKRRNRENSIATTFENTTQNESLYWRKELMRIVDVVKFLSSRGLAFRGHNQILG